MEFFMFRYLIDRSSKILDQKLRIILFYAFQLAHPKVETLSLNFLMLFCYGYIQYAAGLHYLK